jgi:S1-C subfamily serine protease
VDVFAAFFNDAGGGKDDAGYARLPCWIARHRRGDRLGQQRAHRRRPLDVRHRRHLARERDGAAAGAQGRDVGTGSRGTPRRIGLTGKEVSMRNDRLLAILRCGIAATALSGAAAFAAAPPAAPAATNPDTSAYQHLVDASRAVVGVKVKALANARSNANLGQERSGSGVLFAPHNLVLTIGYLILEADSVEITTTGGRTVPAIVAAYDHATGFGLLRPIVPIDVKPIHLGASDKVESLDRLLVATGADEDSLSVATVVSKRQFAGYWEYLIDGAIFTSPPRPDFGGAALINKEGELVGIGSLFVMDAMNKGERLPGNMFVPIDLLKPVLEEMIATGKQKGARRPWIGLNSTEEDGRLKVIRVSSDGPAEKAGIEPGDIILSLSGKKIENLADFYRRLWSAGEPGVEVTLKVLKGADVIDVKVLSIDRAENIRRKPTI